VTVRDGIEMTEFGDEAYLTGMAAEHQIATFSPDGDRFVFVLKNGNLQKNTNDYQLVLFTTDGSIRPRGPTVLVSLSSSSNRPGIQEVRWLNNHKLAFLGENKDETQQLYTIDCDSKELHRITNHPTSLLHYDMTMDEGELGFAVEIPKTSIVGEEAIHKGIIVTTQPLTDLIARQNDRALHTQANLFLKRKTDTAARQILVGAKTFGSDMWIAPNGTHVVFKSLVEHVPESWKKYDDPILQSVHSFVQYEILDTTTGRSHPLIDAPLRGGTISEIVWSPDNQFVVVSQTYLPFDTPGESERDLRSNSYVVQVYIPSGEIVPIAPKNLKLLGWNAATRTIICRTTDRWGGVNGTLSSNREIEGEVIGYRLVEHGWQAVSIERSDLEGNRKIDVLLEEDVNIPPKVFVVDRESGQKSLLLDLNPQFAALKFGRVEDISFTNRNGKEIRAGLYHPPDEIPGNRYPLVIQTHGWFPKRFWIRGGPLATGYAAQALAARGIVVIQLEEDLENLYSLREMQTESANYESAIDHLDATGLIDRHKVGIVAFSQTGAGVGYALTHSDYNFAAASMDSTADYSYFYYLALMNFLSGAGLESRVEGYYGGPPYQNNFSSWLKNSLGFNIDKIRTPIRLQANGPADLTFIWESFVGLRRIRRPVELIYLPEAPHNVVKPSDQFISQQGNLDWFCFWLKGEEDHDAAKAEQYGRWHELRDLQESKHAVAHPSSE